MKFFFNKRGGVGRGATHPEPAPLPFLLGSVLDRVLPIQNRWQPLNLFGYFPDSQTRHWTSTILVILKIKIGKHRNNNCYSF